MTIKSLIYTNDDAEAILGHNLGVRSGRINSIIVRYGQIISEECPELTEAEWSAICDVLNGSWLQAEVGDLDPAHHIWMEIDDGDRLNGLGTKWGIDAQDLAMRVRAMPFVQKAAIMEVATRFWKSPKLNELVTRDLLLESEAKIKP